MNRNSHYLNIITAERIKSELDKMLTCTHPVMALEMLKGNGTMKYVIPELCDTYDMGQNRYHSGTVWQHTLKVVEGTPADLPLRMAALLHDIGKIQTRTVENGDIHFLEHEKASADMARDILKRLKYRNSFIDEVDFLVRHYMD